MSVLVLNTLPECNDEVLELQNQICAQSEGSEVVYTKDMKILDMRSMETQPKYGIYRIESNGEVRKRPMRKTVIFCSLFLCM